MNNYMLYSDQDGSYVSMMEGIRRKTLVHGESTVLCKFQLDKNTTLPLHSHPHEQTGFLLSGKLLFTIDGDEREVSAGDSWCIRPDVEHGAQVVEDTVVIEVFSPVREDYL